MKYKAIYANLIKILAIACIAFVVSKCVNNNPPYTDQFQKQKTELDSLGKVIIKLNTQQSQLNTQISDHKFKIDSLSEKIITTKQIILNTQNYYGKKIHDVRTYTPTQLDKFFTDRYK